MKRISNTKPSLSVYSAGFFAILLILTGLWAWSPLWAGPGTAAESAPSGKPVGKASEAPSAKESSGEAKLRDKAFSEALAGQFEQGLEHFRGAAKRTPKDSATDQAITLLNTYLKRQTRYQAEQKADLAREVKRMEWAFLAQRHQKKLDKAPYVEALRKTINDDLNDAYNDIPLAQTAYVPRFQMGFEDALDDEAKEIKSTALRAIRRVRKHTQEALKHFKDTSKDSSEYAKVFRAHGKALLKQLNVVEKAWEKADTTSVRTRWQSGRDISAFDTDLANTVTDLETLVTKDPWKVALLHGRIARQIAPDPQAITEMDWYRKLIVSAEGFANQSVLDAEWSDALSAYFALEDLDPDNETYKAEAKKVRQHVRVLRLYGDEEEDEADQDHEESPDEAKDDSDEPAWKEIVAGADAEMVRKAISKLSVSYVAAVDFRKLARGALESIKVLAETPQVRKTFPGLADEGKRKEFIEAIDTKLKDIEKPDSINNILLHSALNSVLYSSEESVKLPTEVLVVEFTDGFLNELDRFSDMIWPHDVINFNKATLGKFPGIGVQIQKKPNDPLRVITPLLGTPAFKAGLQAGDLILKVDGFDTKLENTDQLVKRIMGPTGTKVTLTIRRRDVPKPFDVDVIRRSVHVRTVKGWKRKESGEWTYILPDEKTGYVRLTQFTETTHGALREALNAIRAKGVRSLVLDLRSNPGGLLGSATRIADEFIDQERRIVFTRGRQVPRKEFNATSSGSFLDGDVVVLVDRNSASAAEVLSGALKDWNRAKIVGQRSYGKGSVQNIIPIQLRGPNNSYLKLTTAYYYLPSGRLVHRRNGSKDWGVDPDVSTPLTPRQMRRWLTLQQKNGLLKDFQPDLLKADLELQYDSDVQLNAAVLLLDMMRLKRGTTESKRVAAEEANEPSDF